MHHRVLHVWSAVHCRWQLWKGTLAAWEALPHAVVIGCTVASALAVVHLAHIHKPAVPAPAQVPVPQYVYLAGTPQQGSQAPDDIDIDYIGYPYLVGGGGYEHRCHRHWEHCKRRVASAPEPASWALMLAGLAGMGFAARRRVA